MKKIPIIGLLIGAVVALFAMKKGKSEEEEPEKSETSGDAST